MTARMREAFLGTTSGVLRLRDGALEPLGLEGRSVTALHASDDALLAGTYGEGLFRSGDGGNSWERVDAGSMASTFRFVTAGTGNIRTYNPTLKAPDQLSLPAAILVTARSLQLAQAAGQDHLSAIVSQSSSKRVRRFYDQDDLLSRYLNIYEQNL